MTSSFARYISLIFNPLILLVAVPFILLLKLGYGLHYTLLWTGYTFFFLAALAIFILDGVRKGVFTNMDVSKREQRPLLFKVCGGLALLYLAGIYFFDGPQIIMVIGISILIGIVLTSIINTRLKASMHVATISALIFVASIILSGYYLLLLFLIPLVAWARLKIHRHTLPETVVGGLLGVLLSLCIYALVSAFS